MQDVRSADLTRIAQDLQIRKVQVENVVQLLDEGNTIPFAARYQKEKTGGLNEPLIRKVKMRVDDLRRLSQRKQSILKSIETKGKLTPYLRTAVLKAESDKRLEDLYLPYKPKPPSPASTARDRGVGALADAIWDRDPAVANLEAVLPTFVNPEQQLHSDIDVLNGVQHILAEKFAETAPVRAALRGYLWEAAKVKSSKRSSAPPGKSSEYKDFFAYVAPLRRIPPHRVLALNRGEMDGILDVQLECNTDKAHQVALRALADFAHKEALAQQRAQNAASESSQPNPPDGEPAKPEAESVESAPAETEPPTVSEPETTDPAPASDQQQPFDTAESESNESSEPEQSTSNAEPVKAEPTEATAPTAADPEGYPLCAQAPYRTTHAVFLRAVLDDALKRLLLPEFEQELREELTAGAERHAIDVFAKNLRTTLLQPPVRNRRVLAIDPTYRGNSQLVVLDEDGNVLDHTVIQPHGPLKKVRKQKKKPAAAKDKPPAAPTESPAEAQPATVETPQPAPPSTETAPESTDGASETQNATPVAKKAEETPQNVPPAAAEDVADDKPDIPVSGGQPTTDEESSEQSTQVQQRTDDEAQQSERTPPDSESAAAPEAAPSPVSDEPTADSQEDHTPTGQSDSVKTPTPTPAEAPDESATPAPKEPPRDYRGEALAILTELIGKYEIDLVAIGNGNGARDMEELLTDVINQSRPNLEYVLVNEAGVSVYAVGALGREEMPDFSNNVRCAASIGRRLQDPLSEFVKVEPQSVGVGVFQHDVGKRELKETLEEVVEACVNYVGVDLNRAHASLLRHVAGLNPMAARETVEYRKKNGPFHNRQQLLQNTGIGEARFRQAAGFLKVCDGDNPLDRCWIHPEHHGAAEKLLEELGYGVDVILDDARREELQAKLKQITPREAHARLGVGVQTLLGILDSLGDPNRDVRDEMPPPNFKKGVTRLEDLKPGMKLRANVLNVVEFGVFVDIGLQDSGLVHISQLANRFIKSPYEVVNVHDVVDVWVINIDEDRRRVSLTMLPPGTTPADGKSKYGKGRSPRGKRRDRPEKSKLPKPAAPAAKPQVEKKPEAEPTVAAAPRPEQPPEPAARSEKPKRPAPPRHDRPKPKPPRTARKKRTGPKPKLTQDALEGKVPLRSFGELSVFFSKQDEETPPNPAVGNEEPKAADQEPSNEASADATPAAAPENSEAAAPATSEVNENPSGT